MKYPRWDISYEISHLGASGNSALHVACMHGQTTIAFILLRMGHSPSLRCKNESTPLADAAGAGSADLVEYLGRRNPQCVNSIDVDGDSPLHNAARGDYSECCKILLLNGADINCVNKNGQKPVDLCTDGGQVHALLTSRLADLPQIDRFVLGVFQHFAEFSETGEFNVRDIACVTLTDISNNEIQEAILRLVEMGVLEQTRPRTWKIGSLSVLDEPSI